MNGNDDFMYWFLEMPDMLSDAAEETFDIGSPMDGGSVLYWGIIPP